MNYKPLAVLCGIFLVISGLNVGCNHATQGIALEVKAAPRVALGDNAAIRVTIKNIAEDINEIDMTWYGFGPSDVPRQMTIGLPPTASAPGESKALQLIWESSNAGILGTDVKMPSLFSGSDDKSSSGKKIFDIEYYLQTLSPGTTEIIFTLKDGNDILATQKVDISVKE